MPIRSHRLVAVCTLALLALSMAPAATAQGLLTLSVSPEEAEASVGAPTLFDVTLHNPTLVAKDVAFAATNLTAGWTHSFAHPTLSIAPGETAQTTLTVHMADGAEAGDAGALTVRAYENGTEVDAASPVDLAIRVVAPPKAETPPPAGETTPPRPLLAILASNSTAAPGDIARGNLTIHNGDTRSLGVRLTLTDTAGWNVRLDGVDFYTIHPGHTRVIPLLADVPASAANGTTRSFDVRATSEGHAFDTAWTLRVDGEPTTRSQDAGATTGDGTQSDGSGSDGTSTANATTTSATDDTETVALTLHKLLVEVAPGATDRALLTLHNPTLATTTVHLSAEAPDGWTVDFETTTIPLDPNDARQLWFSVTAPADAIPGGIGTGTIHATADGLSDQRATFSVSPIPAPLVATDSAPHNADDTATLGAAIQDDDNGNLIPIAAGLGTIGIAATAISRRPWRERILWGGIGLYTRLLRPDILRHEEREKLHAMIGEQPGIHFHALQRELAWNTGTLTYHLRVLERHNFITSRRDGQLRRFYHVGNAPRKEQFAGPSGLRADVLEAIRNQPGLSQSDLTLALGANKQTVNYHVKALERQGQLRIEKRGRDTFLYIETNHPPTHNESASA